MLRFWLWVCVVFGAAVLPAFAERPNIVFILVDDLGATDVGFMGSKFYQTPHIDKLAQRGMVFTQAYAACTVCSPTRTAFLTGQAPARTHVTDWIEGHKRPFAKLLPPNWTMHLPDDAVTVAMRLKAAGYATGTFGKWHMGGEGYEPEKFGFDVNFGGDHRGQPPSYFYPYKIPVITTGVEGEYLTDRITTEVEKFIETNKDRPFFAYVPHYTVHTPLQGKPDLVKKYKDLASADAPQKNPVYAAMIESLDDSVGRIVAKLEQLKLTEKTIVVFNSDNGGLIGPTKNLGLRAGKGSTYEGGHRVPLAVCWPGVVKPGSTCATPVITYDYYPTLLAATGTQDAAGHAVDGENLLPLWKQTGTLQRENLYWHYPHYHPGGATPYSAIRHGDWKLIQFYEDNRLELYDLKKDPEEQQNLAVSRTGEAAQLQEQLQKWLKSVGAQMPVRNPNHDAEKNKTPNANKGNNKKA